MGEKGRPIEDVKRSTDPKDIEAWYVADVSFTFAALASKAKFTHAPLEVFEISPEPHVGGEFDFFHWRILVRHLGPWLRRGVVEALLDPDLKLDGEKRFRMAAALQFSGEKDKPNKARDIYHAIGMMALEKSDVAVEADAISSASQLALAYLEKHGTAMVRADTIYRTYNKRADIFAEILAGTDGDGFTDLSEDLRKQFKN